MRKSYGFAVFLAFLLIIGACDSRIKEHPLPPELKRQLDMKNNPALQAKAISGKLTADAKLVQSVPGNTTLFVFLRAKGVEGGPPLARRDRRAVSSLLGRVAGRAAPPPCVQIVTMIEDRSRALAAIDRPVTLSAHALKSAFGNPQIGGGFAGGQPRRSRR